MSTLDGRSLVGVTKPTNLAPVEEVGAPGSAIVSGYIIDGEKDAALQGVTKYRTYSDILANVGIVGAGVRFFLNLMKKATWSVTPKDDSAEAQRLADLTYEILNDMDMPWSEAVGAAALYKFYGFSILEWTMKLRPDGEFGFQSVKRRSQKTIERWDTDQHGNVLGVAQVNPQNGKEIYIPRWKLVHLADSTLNDSPEGMGLFRHLVKAAKRLERYELLEAWGYETDLRGIPIGRGPLTELQRMVKRGELDAAQAAAIRKPIEDFVKKHNRSPSLGMLLDSSVYRGHGEQQTPINSKQWDVELLKGDGGPHEQVAAAIERTMHEIARVLGVEHLLLGSNDRGSFALSADKSQTFGMIVESALREIGETFKRDLLKPLWEINGWDLALLPTLETDQVQYRDIEAVTGALRDMAQAGAPLMPDDPAIGEIRDILGLSKPSPESIQMALDAHIASMQPPDPNEDPNQDDTQEDQ